MGGRMADENETALEIVEEPVKLRDGGPPLVAVSEGLRTLTQKLVEAEEARAQQDREHRDEVKRLLLDVIEIDDAFGLILKAASDLEDKMDRSTKRWIANFRAIRRQLLRLLSHHGVNEIETLDQVFDPRWHSVSELVRNRDEPDGTIVKLVKKGYVWRTIVLRRAEVVVVRNTGGA